MSLVLGAPDKVLLDKALLSLVKAPWGVWSLIGPLNNHCSDSQVLKSKNVNKRGVWTKLKKKAAFPATMEIKRSKDERTSLCE